MRVRVEIYECHDEPAKEAAICFSINGHHEDVIRFRCSYSDLRFRTRHLFRLTGGRSVACTVDWGDLVAFVRVEGHQQARVPTGTTAELQPDRNTLLNDLFRSTYGDIYDGGYFRKEPKQRVATWRPKLPDWF